MLHADSIRTVNRAIEGYALLREVLLDSRKKTAELHLDVDLGGTSEEARKEYRLLRLTGVESVAIWTYEEKLPNELAAVEEPSAAFMDLFATFFREQHIYEWEMFASPKALPTWRPGKRSTQDPTYHYGASADLASLPSVAVYLERPRSVGNLSWTMRFWFSEIRVVAPAHTALGRREYDFIKFAQELEPLQERNW